MDIDLFSYIMDEALILVPVLYIIGMVLKSTPKIPDWTIPWVIMLLSIVLSCGLIGISMESAVQGILVAGATVMSNQLVKQSKNK